MTGSPEREAPRPGSSQYSGVASVAGGRIRDLLLLIDTTGGDAEWARSMDLVLAKVESLDEDDARVLLAVALMMLSEDLSPRSGSPAAARLPQEPSGV